MEKPGDTITQRIANALLLNASFIDNLGLMHGKMGIAVYFLHLARETKNNIYESYAGELIDEVYEEISTGTPVDFENGLAGIGWGIEYLVEAGFIEADTDGVLADFDERIAHELAHHCPEGIGLLDGLMGLGAYFLMRIKQKGAKKQSPQIIVNRQALTHLVDLLDQKLTDGEIEKLLTEGPLTRNLQPATRDPQPFDLARDYLVLLWFLSEVYREGVFNAKVEKMIQRLVGSLAHNKTLPKHHGERLLLALGLQKTISSGWNGSIKRKGTVIGLGEILNGLSGIDRETLMSELRPGNASLRYGTAGIAWLYRQLFVLTNDPRFKEEMKYWTKQTFSFEGKGKGLAGFGFDDTDHAFGIFEGLAGIGLEQLYMEQYNYLTI